MKVKCKECGLIYSKILEVRCGGEVEEAEDLKDACKRGALMVGRQIGATTYEIKEVHKRWKLNY